ncbi:exosome complex protein Rrp42 [Candidatus Pacearchaeota archaeon]|nr:exosome complex protein Rrp42 [Candidatus Pacearchaeota archaeon]
MQIPNINRRKISVLLKENKRLDGRSNYEHRPIHIETGVSNLAEGSARVRIGKTDVIVGIKMNVQAPYTDHQDEGTMVVSMEFSSTAGERYEPGPPKMDSIEIARVVDRGIRESGFIDWKKLCIESGKRVWSVNVDIYCINDDGNAMDASALAAVVALKTAVFPVYDEEIENVSYGEFTKNPLPLTSNLPLTMTFYKIGDNLLLDPTRDEEDSSDSRITLAISAPKKDKMINAIQKGAETPLSEKDLDEIIQQIEKTYDLIFPDIEKKIKDIVK